MFNDTPKGTRTAIALNPESPVRAVFVWQGSDLVRAPSCMAFLEDMSAETIDLAPIEGTVESLSVASTGRGNPRRPSGSPRPTDQQRWRE